MATLQERNCKKITEIRVFVAYVSGLYELILNIFLKSHVSSRNPNFIHLNTS